MDLLLKKIFTSVFYTFSFIYSVQAQNKSSITNDLNSCLNLAHSGKGFFGEILVAKGGEILFHEAVGLSSIEQNVELRKGAKYKIASITKTFTASLIEIAAREGKLDLHDPAISYISLLSPRFKNITVHQLLTHTSGLPHNEGIDDYWKRKSKLEMDTSEVLAEINDLDLVFEPGSDMHYSSPGYYLLAAILEAVYKDHYQNILDEKILNPLKMEETGSVNTLEIIKGMTSGYHQVSDKHLVVAPYRNFSMLKGAGDLYSTSIDLLKWSNSILFSDPSEERMLFSGNKNLSEERKGYSIGWNFDFSQRKKYFHGGGTWGYSTFLALYPKEEMTIIILSNISSLSIDSIAEDIEQILFGNFTMPEFHEVSEISFSQEAYIGNFLSESGNMKLDIYSVGGDLFIRLNDNPAFQIYPKENHQFFGKKVEIEITFTLENGKATRVTAERMGKKFKFIRQ